MADGTHGTANGISVFNGTAYGISVELQIYHFDEYGTMPSEGFKTVNIRKKDFKKLSHLCIENEVTKSEMLEIMVKYYLEHHPDG